MAALAHPRPGDALAPLRREGGPHLAHRLVPRRAAGALGRPGVRRASGAGRPLQGLPHRPQGRPAGRGLPPLTDLPAGSPCPPILPYGWRTLDRRWLLDDPRLHDRGAEPLREAHSPAQLYLTTGEGGVAGPWATVCAEIPDLHHFSGRGARDVLPLWCDAGAQDPNATAPRGVRRDEVFFVVTALLGQPGFGARLGQQAGELRLPLPRSPALWAEGVLLGARLVAACTEVEAMAPLPAGEPSRREGHLCLGGVPILALDDPAWAFRAGGLAVLPRLVAGRLGAGRWSSPLDALGVGWSPRDTDDLARALARVRAILDLAPALAGWLDRVLAADDLWGAAEWPAAADVVR
ncbi:MAG: type ISP restriction/modification enzyme [bacterium]